MRVLAFETSSMGAEIALLEADHLVAETRLPEARRTAQGLAPALADLLAQASWKPSDVQLVAISQGPGSFTGLRIGVTAAKVFAYATGAEILGIDTLEAIAAQAVGASRIRAVLDAQRHQVFAASFEGTDLLDLRRCESPSIVDLEPWLAELQAGDLVTGPGLRLVDGRLPAWVKVASEENWAPRAETIGKLAWRDWRAGRRDDVWKLVPQYYRPSAAEEKPAKTGPKDASERGVQS